MAIIYYPNDGTQKEEPPVMHRTRLYHELDEHHHCSLIGVTCDSGFGKTSLIRGYLSYKKIPAVWCTFSENISPADDMEKICNALRRNSVSSTIVFDNCAVVADDSRFFEIVSRLIQAPNNYHVFLLGNTLPKFPFSVMRAKGEYFELTHEDLALSREETEEYYNDYHGMSMRGYELDFLIDRTRGWYISNQLIYLYLKKNRLTSLESLDLNFLNDITDINNFFSYSLYENQTLQMQTFMLNISPLTELDPEIINLLLDIEDAEKYLAELERHHGFVYTDADRTLRFHPLFRQFLYRKYIQSRHNDHLLAHRKLAEIYEKKHLYMKAFTHAVACNDYVAAIRLMSVISKRYNAIHLLNIIDGHLEEISPDLLFSNTSLFLLRCIPEHMTLQLLQPLDDAIKNETDILRQANLQHRLGALYYHIGNVNMSLDLLEKSLASAGLLGNTEVMAFNYQLLADCHLTMGDPDQALRCARNALYLSEQNNIPILQLHTLEVFARIQLAAGNIDTAKDYITQAMEIARPDAYELFWLNAVQSMIDIAQNNPKQAILHAEKSTDIVKESICGWDIAYTHLILARALIFSGQNAEAKRHLSIAYENSSDCALLRYDVLSELRAYETTTVGKERRTQEMTQIAESNNYYWIKSSDSSEESDVRPNTSHINIRTMGNFSITYDGISIKIKRLASIKLLHLLILNRGHFVSKDYFIDQLFPDSTLSSGTNNFNVALSVLRKNIDTAAGVHGSSTSSVIREKNRYRLNPDLVTIDAETFESAYMQLKKNRSTDLNKWLELSILYGEPFMQEYPYESLLESERERLFSYQKDVALTIARIYSQQDDLNKSFYYYKKVLTIDAYDEDVYYELIELLLDHDAPVKAQTIADKMKFHIEGELGVSCSKQLQIMFDYYYKTK